MLVFGWHVLYDNCLLFSKIFSSPETVEEFVSNAFFALNLRLDFSISLSISLSDT